MHARPRVTSIDERSTMFSSTLTTTGGGAVLFHITQVHTPELCPSGQGGSNSLYDDAVPGVHLVGRYGANAQHTLFLVVEADDVNAIHKFLWPGFKRCTSTITPVSEVPVPEH
jgi:Domain of unknown function (DUF3303)